MPNLEFGRDEVAEWLRRWTANPLCSARVGSNPILVAFFQLLVKAITFQKQNEGQSGSRTRDLSHPKRESYHQTNQPMYCHFETLPVKQSFVLGTGWPQRNIHVPRVKAGLSFTGVHRPTSQCIVTLLLFLGFYQVSQNLSTHKLQTKTSEQCAGAMAQLVKAPVQ